MAVKYYNWIFDEIASRFGEDVLDRIVGEYGGLRITIPNKPTKLFVKVCGIDAAAWLCEVRGGENVDIGSKGALKGKRARHRRNIKILASSKGTRALAREFGLTERYVLKIKKQGAKTASNGD